MAAVVNNYAKARGNEFVNRVVNNDPANSAIVIVMLKTAESNATLQDYASLGAALAAGGGTANVEANFTNYARKVLTDAALSAPTVDNTGNKQYSTFPAQTYTAPGGATNNTVVKVLTCYDSDTTGGTDSNIIIVGIHDANITTDGNDCSLSAPATGFYEAA
jgi:acyl CoA:acetate/3-ketoacid CoA transferase